MSPKQKAIELRKQGYSYTEISRRTGLAKSTLSYHLSAIAYIPNQQTIRKIGTARIVAARTIRNKKLSTFDVAKRDAETMIGSLSPRDTLLLGIGLYIGEGSKTNDIIRLVNTDVQVLQFFVTWLKQFGVTKDNLALRIHIYPDTKQTLAEQYWLRALSLPQSALQRSYVDRRTDKSKNRQGTHLYGTAHVTVKSRGNPKLGVTLARLIGALSKKVLK